MGIFTRFSLKNVIVIFLIVAMLVAGGIYSMGSVQTEMMPNIEFPIITVITVYPGAAPNDVADSISRPFQKALSGIQGIKKVDATSNENLSLMILSFDYSANMEKAETAVKTAIEKVTIPDAVQKPKISKISYGSIPVVGYSVSYDGTDNEFSTMINDKIQPALAGIKGMGGVSINGVNNKQVFIRLDSKKLKEKGVTTQDVQQALSANNISYPIGSVDIDGKTLPLRVTKKVDNLNDIKAIPIVIMPDTTKLVGESMGKMGEAIGGLYSALGQMGESMGQMGKAVGEIGNGVGQLGNGMGQMQKGVESLGAATGLNSQAVALISMIQKNQTAILTNQEILKNPQATKEQQAGAQQQIIIETQTNIALQASLEDILNKMKQLSDSAANTATKPSGSSQSMSSSSNAANTSSNAAYPSSNNMNAKAATSQQKGALDTLKSMSSTNTKIELKTVYLKDIADITYEKADTTFYSRTNLKPTVTFYALKNDDANSVQLAKDTGEMLEKLQSESNGKIHFDKIMDTSKYITDSIDGMVREGLLGALFAILVIAVFLRDIRATLIAVVSIPLSILTAIILMPRLGITLNMMTLSGMAVAVGRIVDDSIVVIENIYRRLTRTDDHDVKLIEHATGEVSSAITSSTITTIAVFLPLGFVEGIIGKVFYSFALTVVICIASSLLVAITIVPVLGKLLLLKWPPKHRKETSILESGYKRILKYSLSHRMIIVLLSLALFIGSGFVAYYKIGVQFLPAEKTRTIEANLTLPAGTSHINTNEKSLEFEKYVYSFKDKSVESVTATVGDNQGRGAAFGMMQGSNQAKLTIVLNEKADVDETIASFDKKANELEKNGAVWRVSALNNFGSGENVTVVINGDNFDDLKQASDIVSGKLKEIPELSSITNNLSEKKPEITVNVDNVKAAKEGLNPLYVAGMVRGVLSESDAATVEIEGKAVNVKLGMKDAKLDKLQAVKDFELRGVNGSVKLSKIAEVKQQDGPVSISERDGKRFASVSANINSKDTAKLTEEVTLKLEEVKGQFKKGITYSVGGSVDDINSSFSQMGIAMLVAIFLVFVTMLLTFKEATAPFSILFSLPFAATGALLGLIITNKPISMSGMVGILMLIGIVVTNAIVFVDRVQSNRKKGMGIDESLLEAGAIRLRPIIMTAAATIMALIPLALGFSEGAIISEELGIVVIGGLTMSTVLTLVVVPVAYSILEKFKLWVTGKSEFDITEELD